MTATTDPRVLNRLATSQGDRLRTAPAPRRVRVDGRGPAQRLAFAAGYGKLIQFYDLTDLPDGTWEEFFASGPSVRLALQVGLDLRDFEAAFDRLLGTLREAGGLDAQKRAADAAILGVLRLVRLIETDADASTVESILGAAIASRHRGQLADPARRLIAHLAGQPLEHGLRRAAGKAGKGWVDRLASVLDELAAALLGVLEQDRAAAADQFDASLRAEGHAPQAALYNAFAILFGHAQRAVNRFPERLVRFYHEAILHQDSRAGSPDRLYLTFTPAKGVAQASIPAGTLFSAGADTSGQPVRYALDQAVAVGNAAITGLRTLTVTREAPFSSASPPFKALPAQVLSGVAVLADQPPPIAKPFPLFGAEETGASGALAGGKARLGFALASPTLMLAGGDRTVRLGLTFTPDTLAAATALLQPVGGDPQASLARILASAFALRYSTAGGWVAIAGSTVTPPAEGQDSFTLSFTLTANAAPFVALSAAPANQGTASQGTAGQSTAGQGVLPATGPVPDDTRPVLVAELLQEPVALGALDLHPYAVLSGLALSDLSIAVEVGNLTDLTLRMPGGQAAPGQPFPPFGSPPVQHAALDVAAPELFAKTLDRFSIRIAWYGLPVTSTGFSGYYWAYAIDADGVRQPPGTLFDNRSFQASLTVLQPGLWTITGAGTGAGARTGGGTEGETSGETDGGTADAPLYLFRTAADTPVPEPRAPLLAATTLEAPSVAAMTPPAYYDPTSSAVRLALTEPGYAFGNTLYAANTMAASVELTAAAAACAQRCASRVPAAERLDTLRATVARAPDKNWPDKNWKDDVAAALPQTLSRMAADAATAIQDAIGASGAPADQRAAWRSGLSAALAPPDGPAAPKLRSSAKAPDPAETLGRLGQWIAANGAALGPDAQAPLGLAQALVDGGTTLTGAQATANGQSATAARQTMGAAVQTVQADLTMADARCADGCLERCMAGQPPNGFPNQPWLPLAASLSVAYTAAATLPGAPSSRYYRLLPFDGVEAVEWTAGAAVPLLAPVPEEGALFIGLSPPGRELALLFTLAPGEDGWPEETPPVDWAMGIGAGGPGTGGPGAGGPGTGSWTALTPLSDGTNGLRNSGIVTFGLAGAPAGAALWLRVGVAAAPDVFPLLAGLTTNAATASWVGPGGAGTLGTPLPAGTVTAAEARLPGIGAVAQPAPSFGGRPAASGGAFDLWMAERLRHKGFGIQSWDYARLALSEFPSLWQAAAVPATNGDGTAAPGRVWVVAVPGPSTPGIADPTVPACDPSTLGQIAESLRARISPFVQLSVTSPPYLRMTVTAKLVFRDDDTAEASAARLNDALVRFLSPWPDPALGPRPDDYYTADAVARFIRNRPYVLGILSLDYAPAQPPGAGWFYLTSATRHALTGETAGPRPRHPGPALGPALGPADGERP